MVAKMEHFELSGLEMDRYARQIALPHVGYAGQLKLKRSSVLVVGVGGLGSVSALYLTLAGVGRIGLIEDDRVSLDNLHRQILYTTEDIGESKLPLAAQKLREHNPEVSIIPYPQRLTLENAPDIVKDFDLVVDGTDNMMSRQVINQVCVAQDKAYIFGAVNLFDGQVSVFHASQGPCLACLFPNLRQVQEERQIEQLALLNTVPAVVAALQAAEVVKMILGLGKALIGQLLIYNALTVAFERVGFEKNASCPVCGA
jgi:molybdopterin-synthase adenylyltransferase